jgi:apolipoprotein D and lipocalin family protein
MAMHDTRVNAEERSMPMLMPMLMSAQRCALRVMPHKPIGSTDHPPEAVAPRYDGCVADPNWRRTGTPQRSRTLGYLDGVPEPSGPWRAEEDHLPGHYPRLLALLWLVLVLAGCTEVPEGVRPVTGFDADRYLGVWYEIARLDHSFERGLASVSATYTHRSDGGIDVSNRGYDTAQGHWKEARGRAYFLDAPEVASLKVSFFGPFYGGYHVFALDPDYRWALVAGYSHDYLWILAREREIPPVLLNDLLGRARRAGFNTDALIFLNRETELEPTNSNTHSTFKRNTLWWWG